MGRRPRIDYAKTDWSAGAPRSVSFADVYFSGDGRSETQHVFLDGNRLADRFSASGRLSIGELGFGTGLNLLETWALWEEAEKPSGARLDVLSIEAYPLSADDLARAHAAWPEHARRSARLRALMPPPLPGLHRLQLADDLTLTLAYGLAEGILARIEGGLDAWFFDGFAPAKNPEMWTPAVFAEVARLSRPGVTFATFTAAGEVRRALAEAGFEVEKRAGYGRKRDMLTGRFFPPLPQERERGGKRAPWFRSANAERLTHGASVAIIGGGVAGASLAFAARSAGLRPTIIDPAGLAAGASGNVAGLIMPRLDLGGTAGADFFIAAYLHTLRLLNDFGPTSFRATGVLFGAVDDSEIARQARILDARLLPDGFLELRPNGLLLPQAGVVDPPRFVAALAGDAPIVRERATEIRPTAEDVEIICTNRPLRAEAVILANGVDALRFREARALPLAAVAGQIDWFPEARAPAEALAFGPYAVQSLSGGLVIGATYEPSAATAAASLAATRSNLAAVARFAPDLVAGLDPAASRPRASLRCQTPDRLPIAGPLPDLAFYGAEYDDLRLGKRRDYPPGRLIPRTFILSGLGSRGLVTAPLAAAHVIAELVGGVSPLDVTQAEALHPARFFIRDLKRAKVDALARDGASA